MPPTKTSDKEVMRRAAAKAKKPLRTAKDIIESQAKAAKMTSSQTPKSCPKGQVLRRAYMTSSGKAVPPKCIEDRGGKGTGLVDKNGKRVVVPLREGRLAQYGYFNVTEKSESQRHAALRKAMKGEGDWLSLFRRLVYTSTLTKNVSPERSKIFYDDAYWIKKTFAPSGK